VFLFEILSLENMNKTVASNIKSLLLVAIGIILTGCGIPSVHPLYESGDLKTDTSLQGVWQRPDSGTRFHVMRVGDLEAFLRAEGDTTNSIGAVSSNEVFRGTVEIDQGVFELSNELIDRGLENLYLVQSESDRSEIYLVGVVELAGDRYLDFKQLDFDLGPFSYPVHLFMKSTVSNDTLYVHMFSENWLKEQIRNRQIRIKYEVNEEENYILTAPTAELKKFVEKYGGIEEAYRSTNAYIKVSDLPTFSFEELEELVEDK
jgi:hypothetical protein